MGIDLVVFGVVDEFDVVWFVVDVFVGDGLDFVGHVEWVHFVGVGGEVGEGFDWCTIGLIGKEVW